ncbi:hypothetical protein [Sphingomonas bacterium]|uniref:hypothetical protein n=1 Tax=Sphingomonas bacterium TaxID=1895847 RepID=UPI00157533E3|nr:hypothetical protein [Sphingomonas bacterium]
MSHIPASAMPHAKAHDDHPDAADPQSLSSSPAPQSPSASQSPFASPAQPAPAEPSPEAASPPKDAGPGAGSSLPYGTIAAVGALAIGGIVAALALRRSDPLPPAPVKGKGGRPRKHAKAD